MSINDCLARIMGQSTVGFKAGVRLHFLGVLGAGMLPLSELCHRLGAYVTGSDRAYREQMAGKYPHISFCPLRQGSSADLVVYSLAIDEGDPELMLAREMGIPTVSRAEMLGFLMLSYNHRIGVAGTHGKSTTTALVSTVLSACGKMPTTLSGADLPSGGSFLVGERDYFVFEACEYRDAFLSMHPTGAIINNIEIDHTDYFKDEKQLQSSFLSFADKCNEHILIGTDTPLSEQLASELPRAYTFGSGEKNDFLYNITARTGDSCTFTLYHRKSRIGEFEIGTFGEHNVKNAAGALSLCYLYGADISKACEALSLFRGIPRRQELLGYIGGTRAVYYDYAHHPTEISATVTALKERHGNVTVIFRPHTFTRTRSLFEGFAAALSAADRTVVLDVYAARTEKTEGVGSRELAMATNGGVYLDFDSAVSYCLQNTLGAIVLMGAGDVDIVKERLKEYIDG